MLDWSQKTLAEKSGISEPSIKIIESGRIHSTPDTLGRIQDTFETAGLEFLPQKGVRFRDDLITVLERKEDENVFLFLLDDIYYTLKGTNGEVLWSFVEEDLSPSEVTDKENLIRKEGIHYRSLIKYGDLNLIHDRDEYRWLPEGHFLNNLTAVYENKFATVVNKPGTREVEKVIIIRDPSIAEMKRKEFEIIWSLGEIPH
jgi:transcriptional regulator with XRE-family HTH domain